MTAVPTPAVPTPAANAPAVHTPTVDVHAHVLLPEVEALVAGLPGHAGARELDARRNGPAALAVNGPMVRDRVPRMTDVALRLASMDAQGVDVQLVSPSPRTTTTGPTRTPPRSCTGSPTRPWPRTVRPPPSGCAVSA